MRLLNRYGGQVGIGGHSCNAAAQACMSEGQQTWMWVKFTCDAKLMSSSPALRRDCGLNDAQAPGLGQQVCVHQVHCAGGDLFKNALDHHGTQQPGV